MAKPRPPFKPPPQVLAEHHDFLAILWLENSSDSGVDQVEVGGAIQRLIFHNNCMVIFVDVCSCLLTAFRFDLIRFEWILNPKSLSVRRKLNLVRPT